MLQNPQLAEPEYIVRSATQVVAERLRRDFREFCKRAWPQVAPQRLVWNWHLDAICDHMVYVSQHEIRFLMINIPPRHTKSLIASVLWPVWEWIQNPGTQFISASIDDRLSLEFTRLARRVIEGPWFQRMYGSLFHLLEDENQGRQYRNNMGGIRNATSVQGRVIGSGGDVQLLDDPHDAKKVESDVTRQASLEWHDNSWRSRVNDPKRARKVYIGQRTHDSDIFGHVLRQEGKRWVVLSLPLELDRKRICMTYLNDGTGKKPDAKLVFRDPRTEEGEMLDPKRFDAETAAFEKTAMTKRAWNAQYQQQPEGAGGLIWMKDWWRQWVWPEWHKQAGQVRPLPDFFEVVQFYDTAFEPEEENDFSARTSWGMFHYVEEERDPRTGNIRQGQERVCTMPLEYMEEKFTYPELRDEAINSNRLMQPDNILIEKKASGHSLIQELKRKRLPVRAFGLRGSGGRAKRQGDLIARAHTSSLMLEKGGVFYIPKAWMTYVIDHCAKFPAGDHDDIMSTCTMALQYMRRYYDLTLDDDEPDKELNPFDWERSRRRYV